MRSTLRGSTISDPNLYSSSRRKSSRQHEEEDNLHVNQQKRRTATVFDAVAGRIGTNGFLTVDQLRSDTVKPSAPEEVLLRRVDAPDEIPLDYYEADKKLRSTKEKLPDSDFLKDVHTYVADFYKLTTGDNFDLRSFDETALLALGILLVEACKETLGDTGDMVLTEPQSRDYNRPLDMMSRHQIIGRVVPRPLPKSQSSSESEEDEAILQQPRKRQRRRYRSPES